MNRLVQIIRRLPSHLQQQPSSRIAIAVFSIVFLTHFASDTITSFDSRWSIHLAMSIIYDGDTQLDEYEELIKSQHYAATKRYGGHIYSFYPIGTNLLAVPIVHVVQLGLTRLTGKKLRYEIANSFPVGVELFTACTIVALTAVLIYLIGAFRLSSQAGGLLLAFVFAFGTSAWSTASRALWQHGPLMLMLALALYVILQAELRPWLIQFASLPLAYAYVIRPTASIPIICITIWVLLKHRRYFLPYALWSLPVAIPLFIYNYSIYGFILSPYYLLFKDMHRTGSWIEALTGLLVSPGRGLFVYSPVFLLLFYLAAKKIKNRTWDGLDAALLLSIVLIWLATSNSPAWWAGHSYGPRYFCDAVPFLLYLLIPYIKLMGELKARKRAVAIAAFTALLGISVAMHHKGATDYNGIEWNWKPDNIDLHTQRLWDWKDPPFLR